MSQTLFGLWGSGAICRSPKEQEPARVKSLCDELEFRSCMRDIAVLTRERAASLAWTAVCLAILSWRTNGSLKDRR